MIQLEKYISGTNEIDPIGRSYFMPSHINAAWKWEDQSISSLLEKAALALGELNAFSKIVLDVDLFIQLYVTKEAVNSCRIEGTKTKLDEALMKESDISLAGKSDWVEVNNYIKTLNQAMVEIKTHQTSLNSIVKAHKHSTQNKANKQGLVSRSLEDELMEDLENFLLNQNSKVPALIKIAIAHYQYQTIHPFIEGNRQISRLLTPLFFVEQKILNKPLLYLSTFFEKDKSLYHNNLTSVQSKNDMTQWLKYFLIGIAETAENTSYTLSQMIELKKILEIQIVKTLGKRSTKGILLLQFLFSKPIVYVNQVKEVTNSSFKSANDLVADFVEAGILKETTGHNRNRIFVFEQYLKMFENT
jgi:Fic family protein